MARLVVLGGGIAGQTGRGAVVQILARQDE
jgi:hypothetical protein